MNQRNERRSWGESMQLRAWLNRNIGSKLGGIVKKSVRRKRKNVPNGFGKVVEIAQMKETR
jgi:hypothetical protein